MGSDWIDFPGGQFVGGLTAGEVAELARISAAVSERFLEDDPDKWAWGADRGTFAERTGNLAFLVPLLTALCPPRTVHLRPFRLARAPVTVAQFAEFCRVTGIRWQAALHAKPEHTATRVPFEHAVRYAQWSGARLPTVDEWERAARGPGKRLFPWGSAWVPAADILMEPGFGAWPPGTHAGLATPEGCLDLLGACGQWCDATYAPDPNAWSQLTQRPKYELGRNWPIAMGTQSTVIPNAVLAAGIGPDHQGFLPGFRLACDATPVDDLTAAMAREEQARRDWQVRGVPAPYDARPIARHLAAFGKAALVRTIAMLQNGSDLEQDLARQVLEDMGPGAAPDAIDPLVACTHKTPSAVLALWSVSPSGVVQSGAHRRKGPRQILVDHLAERHPADLARILVRLLTDPDDDVVRFALAGDEKPAPWQPVVFGVPDQVPLDQLRHLADGSRPELARLALHVLASVRRPEDCTRALAALRAGTFAPDDDDARWLAADPDSDALLPALLPGGRPGDLLADWLRRRRAAGLLLPVEHLRPILARELAGEATPDLDVKARRAAIHAAVELGDDNLIEHAARAITRTRGCESPVHETLATADTAFLAGHLEDWQPVSAFRRYAAVLRDDPNCARAAFQIAWMDRAFGSTVTPKRVAWIRALGFRSTKLLDSLATRPSWTVPGDRIRASPGWTRDWNPCVERIAAVGLPSLAAAMARGAGAPPDLGDGFAAAADREAKFHLEQVITAS